MKIVISSGHGKYIRGASGYLDEVDEARKVVERVAEYLREAGVGVQTFHDDTSTSQNENLNTIVNYHNSQTRDLDVSVHFNAYQTTSKPMGTECLYLTQSTLAEEVSGSIAEAGSFIDRGPKYRSDLFFLNSTEEPAILIETCFVDSSADEELYKLNFNLICAAIAEAISGEEIGEGEPPEPPEEPPVEVTGDNRVDIVGRVQGNVSVFVNGTLVNGRRHERGVDAVFLNISMTGDVTVAINGEEFHNKPVQEPPGETHEIPQNHREIEATVFGGASDQENSAYPPYGYLNDTDLYVALPYSFDPSLFPGNPPKVRVFHGELSAVGKVADKGPWTTDDKSYVIDALTRPIAETCHDEGTPLPSGPNAGRVPSNRAGIDLSPALAEMIGVSGKGTVDWEFVEE